MSAELAAAQISKVNENIASAQADFAALSLKLVDDPSNVMVNEQLGQIENEIFGYHKAIARLQAAAVLAAKNDTKAAKAARFKLLLGQRDRLAQSNATTEEIAARLIATFGDLALLFAQLERAVADRASDAQAILAGTRGRNYHAQSEGNVAQLVRLNNGDVTTSLANLVADSGLAQASIPLEPYVVVTRPLSLAGVTAPRTTLSSAVAKANTRLLAAIDGRIEDGKKRLLGNG